jgi:hypothetical protein
MSADHLIFFRLIFATQCHHSVSQALMVRLLQPHSSSAFYQYLLSVGTTFATRSQHVFRQMELPSHLLLGPMT